MKPLDFVKEYYSYAKQSENETGVPALVQLAQAAIESGWGKHAPGNNFHGIKLGSWPKKKGQLLTTHEYFKDDKQGRRFPEVINITWSEKKQKFLYRVKDWFRKYNTPGESFEDHANLIRRLSRYAKAFDTDTPEDFVREVHRGGYSTSPTYSDFVIKVMKTIKNCIDEIEIKSSLE